MTKSKKNLNVSQDARANALAVRNGNLRASRLPKPIKESEAYRECKVADFKFTSTKDISPNQDFIAQERAVRAINMGLGIRKPGYNIYVSGYQGTGKTSVIRAFLEKWSKKSDSPNDWVYLYDFEKPECPKILELPRGEGKKLKKRMDNFVRDLKSEIPRTFQGEEYENAVNSYLSASNERKSKLYSELEKLAKSMSFSVKSTRMGIETIPMLDDRVVSEKEYAKLDEASRTEIESRRTRLEPEVLDFVRKVRNIENETREFIEALRGEYGLSVVGALVQPMIDDYNEAGMNAIVEYLQSVRDHILENLLDFVEVEEDAEEGQPQEPMPATDDRDRFRKYTVNVFIDNSKTKGAPVVIETNPTYYNLFGKIEKNVDHGIYHTDFTMIKSGAIHRANGGYLVINALDIFKTQAIWETLKRVLRNGEAYIEDMGEQYSMLPTSGLRPQAVPLDLKVILIGNDEIYHILLQEDEEFYKIFKIKADFDFKMERNAKNVAAYVSFVATRAYREHLLPFDRSAVACIVEFGSRMVEDQKLLSTQFGQLKDLTIEADYIAREQGAKIIKRAHVEEALDQKFYRLNMVEENLLDMVKNEDILLTVDGTKIGQINALTVYEMGDYAFGKIGRITCTTAISDDGINNIERACRLSGSTHDKGMYIITGFLNAVLAREHNLGVSASVCFEQSYGMIDGDSASLAELIVIISSMAELPVRQNFAVTGSVNQMGEVQAVGGVNEKIEGFYKTCKLIGKSKEYGLILPWQNVDSLMLHHTTRQAVRSGQLKIYPVRFLWEAFEMVTGVELGIYDVHSKAFSKGSALEMIKEKLDRIYKEEERQLRRELEGVVGQKDKRPRAAKVSGS